MMLVRVIFSLMVTLGLLAGAALWHADPPPAEPAGDALEPVVERALELADETAERLEEHAREAAPVVQQAARAALAAVEPPAPTPSEPADEAAPERVEEQTLAATWERPFVEGPSHAGAEAESAIPGPAPSFFDAQAADQDAWAGLIRRMLALRARVEDGT